jgi:hypothetical protein
MTLHRDMDVVISAYGENLYLIKARGVSALEQLKELPEIIGDMTMLGMFKSSRFFNKCVIL